jgi:uncharacterized protein DUF4405
MPTKNNLILDLSMFGIFLVIANPHLTGTTIHEWLAITFSAAIITHLLVHWAWIVKVGKEFFKKLWHQSRLNFLVDTLFFIAMTGSLFSGLMISQSVMSALGIQLNVSHSWKSIHSLLSDTSVVMLGLHFALHWKWLTTNVDRYILNPIRNLFPHTVPNVLAAQSVRVEKDR